LYSQSSASVLLLFSSFMGFFAPTWEHMHVGVMRFQQGPLNPTEALIILQIALYITSVAPHFWFLSLISFYSVLLCCLSFEFQFWIFYVLLYVVIWWRSHSMFWDLELKHVVSIVSAFIGFCSLVSSIQSVWWNSRKPQPLVCPIYYTHTHYHTITLSHYHTITLSHTQSQIHIFLFNIFKRLRNVRVEVQ
jgi:hypothetical protein